jgi:SAM-dependent methyltransferase
MTFEKHEVEDYEKKRYRSWDQKLVHSRENRLLERLLETVGICTGKALDLPCGYGRFSGLLNDKGFTPLNCDLSFFMVERANAKRQFGIASRSPGVVADAVKGLPFKDESFSLVFSMRFFHHLHESCDRKRVLEEFHRVSGKWLLVSYYQTNALHCLQRKLRRKVKKSPTRIKMISRQDFRAEAGSVGFDVEKIYSLFRGLHAQRIALLKKAKT